MVQRGEQGIAKTFTTLSYLGCNTRIGMQLQHLWHMGPGTSTALGALTLPSPSSSAAPSLWICTCAGIHVWRLTLIRKKKNHSNFSPRTFRITPSKQQRKDSYPSPITTECPESKTCYQPPQFQYFVSFLLQIFLRQKRLCSATAEISPTKNPFSGDQRSVTAEMQVPAPSLLGRTTSPRCLQ